MEFQEASIDPAELRDNDEQFYRAVETDVTIHDPEERIVEGRINTDNIDAYGTVLEPQGAVVEPFLNYGSVLYNHQHDTLIGNTLEVEKNNGGIDALWQFVEEGISEEIDKIWRLYKNGWIQGYSVGALPVDWEEKYHDDIEKSVVHFTEWELKEYSVVSVPANPFALARDTQAKKDWDYLVENTVGTYPIVGKADAEQTGYSSSYDDNTEKQTRIVTEPADGNGVNNYAWSRRETLNIRETPSYQDLPIEEDSWDGDAAESNLREWAGGPDKEDVDFNKYFKGFFYRDGESPEEFGSYKLPYADVYDGSIKAVSNGLYAVAAVLEGAQGGVDIPSEDKSSIRNQVEKYYDKMDETVPWNEDGVEIETIEDELQRVGAIDKKEEDNEMEDEKLEKLNDTVDRLEDLVNVLDGLEEKGIIGDESEENEEEEKDTEELEERLSNLEEKQEELVDILEVIAESN